MGGNWKKLEHRESIHSPSLLSLLPLPGRREPDQTTGEITLPVCVCACTHMGSDDFSPSGLDLQGGLHEACPLHSGGLF